MAIWKKVIVSGSSAELAALKVDNLTSGQVVIGGGSAGNLTTTAINGTGDIVATTNATNLVHSGSFSGSFTGDLTSVLGASSQPNFVAYNISTGKFTYAGTGSFAAATASYVTSSNVFGPFGSNSILTASFATTASFVQNAQTASFVQNAVSASFATTASFVQNAVSASFASTASFVQNAVSASFASTASSVNTLNQAVTVNGTLTVTPSGDQEFLVTSTGVRIGNISTDVHTVTGSLNVSGSVVITGSLQATSITASIFGTSSFATSASFATTASFASTASFVQNAVSASFASTASFVQNAVSASFATTASFASTAAQVNNALTFGLGISSSAATYNGSTAVTFHVSGASNLSNNIIPKWNGTGFTNSNVTDTGTQVQIGAGATSGLSVAAGGINVTGNSTFNSNLTVTGDLTVNGTASFVNSTNLYVKDQFITINSGSSTLADSGIVSQYNVAGSGSAFFLEAGSAGAYGRWAVAYDLLGTSTSATADEFMVTAKINQASNPVAAPTWGSTGNGSGNMWVTNAGDIFIYA
jgi:hypothetical protein